MDSTTHISFYVKIGFVKYCEMYPSDRLTQGIDVTFEEEDPKRGTPAVYIMADKFGRVLKIGQSEDVFSRCHKQYKCVTNSTNNRIRQYIKDIGSPVDVYIYSLPTILGEIKGYTVKTSQSKGFEYALLDEYNQLNQDLPLLNEMKK